MKKKKVSNTIKGKKKVWECKYREHYYDDLTNMQMCTNDNSGHYECICKSAFQMQVCPFFKRSNRSCYLEMTDYDKEKVKEFKDKIEQEKRDREIFERSLYEYLKKKYEN